jgi:hypothetical protein
MYLLTPKNKCRTSSEMQLLAQGRNADDAQIVQELDEEPTYR